MAKCSIVVAAAVAVVVGQRVQLQQLGDAVVVVVAADTAVLWQMVWKSLKCFEASFCFESQQLIRKHIEGG